MAGDGDIYKRLTIILSVNDAATAQLSTVTSTLRTFAGVTGQASGQLAKLTHRFMQVGRALVSFLIIRTIGVKFGKFIQLMFEGNQVLEKAATSLERLGGSLGYAQKQIEFVRTTAMRAPFDFQSILGAGRLLAAYGKDLQTYLPVLLDWAAALGATSGELEGYAAAMGKIMAGSPYVMRILTTRAVGLDQWKAALEATNRALPKSERFTQALMIALQRFEGQAVILAKTMAGLRTNIRDVWVEITREIGLSMFTRIRSTLFGVYEGLRDIADNQREMLHQIGDAYGLIAGRLIIIVKESMKLGTYWNRVMVVVKNIALFLIARAMVAAVIRVVAQVGYAVAMFFRMKAAVMAVHGALLIVTLAVASLTKAIADAQLQVIDFRIALGDITAGLEIIESFSDREEKVFTREELSTLRSMQTGIRDIITALSDMGLKYAAIDKQAPLWNGLQGAKNLWVQWRNSLSVDALKPMFEDLDEFVARAEPLMASLFGDDAWGARARGYVDALREMSVAYENSKIVPDADEWHTAVQNIGKEVLGIVPMLEPLVALSKKNVEAAEAVGATYKTQEVAMAAIGLIMEEYEAHQRGIAGYAENTAAFTTESLRALEGEMINLSGILPLHQAIERVAKNVAAIEKDRLKGLAEIYDRTVAEFEYVVRIAKLQAELSGDTREYAGVLQTVIDQVETWMVGIDKGTAEGLVQWNALREMLLVLGVEFKNVTAASDELSFSVYAGFTLMQQALSPFVSAFGAIADGAKAMKDAFASAAKGMVKWMLQLIAKLVVMVVLMSMFRVSSGDMTGWQGALSAVLGGGLSPERAAFGMRGPSLAFAGGGPGSTFGDITPRAQPPARGRGDTIIHVHGPVYDGESFMRQVDVANYKLAGRKGGG